MRRLLLFLPTLTLALALPLAIGCGDPCEKLQKKICAHVKDERACERSKKDMEGFNEQICSHALSIYDRLYDE